jgi:hypothetical protein
MFPIVQTSSLTGVLCTKLTGAQVAQGASLLMWYLFSANWAGMLDAW